MKDIVCVSFKEDLIQQVGEYIVSNFLNKGKDISKLAIIFGGKRPSLFLKKFLAERIKTNFYPPQFFSMDEFVEYIVSKNEKFSYISELDAIFIIYKLMGKYVSKNFEHISSFPEFLPLGYRILGFLEELYLEDIESKLLKTIQPLAEIGYDIPESINKLLQHISEIKEEYHNILLEKKSYTRGLLYYLSAKYCEDNTLSEFDTIFFCGFYYLHKTEEKIITTLYNKENTVLFFHIDKDERYKILENYFKKLHYKYPLITSELQQNKIHIYAGLDTYSQVCVVREILKDIQNKDNTVIVLPDPDKVVPLLYEIAPIVKKFNVSLGYPVKTSQVFSLFKLLFTLQESRKEDKYYTKDLLKLLTHPMVKNLNFSTTSIITQTVIQKIEEIILGEIRDEISGSVFISLNELKNCVSLYTSVLSALQKMEIFVTKEEVSKIIDQLVTLLFSLWEEVDNFKTFSLKLNFFLDTIVKNTNIKDLHPFNLKIIKKLFLLQEKLSNLSFGKEKFVKEDIFNIFLDILSGEIVSFYGSPLKGLQILGLLETRSLSFENVIVLDMNETVLPKLDIYDPLIPSTVLMSLGINRVEIEEEIQRYHFMRLISSAKNVYLIYEESKDKERSRFLEEIIFKVQKSQIEKNKNVEEIVIPKTVFKINLVKEKFEIKKTEKILQKLNTLLFSSTMLDDYIKCPLMFYYKHVLKLKEVEEFKEEIEGVDIGNFVHEFLKEIFSPLLSKKFEITPEFEHNFYTYLEHKFNKTFSKRLKGEIFLIDEVVRYRMKTFLKKEKERADEISSILYLEELFTDVVKFNGKTYNFTFRVDRIDELKDGTLLVIDYKTGKVERNSIDIKKLVEKDVNLESIRRYTASFQIPLYWYFIKKVFPEKEVNSAIYDLRESVLIEFLNKDKKINEEVVSNLLSKCIEIILTDIFTSDKPFIPIRDEKFCTNCEFQYLCR